MNTPRPIRPEIVTPVPLRELVAGLGLRGAVPSDRLVTDVTLDSRLVGKGGLYVALPGLRVHGAEFASQAATAGAVAVLTDALGAELAADSDIPVLTSDRLRADMGVISSRLFGEPATRLATFAVTGTNGKTTTVALLEAGLAACGVRVGTIGTVGFRLDGVPVPSGRGTVTTPDAPDLQALLAVMAERGANAVALEVSSHALALDRVAGLRFDVAAFLNLGRDHLDFHFDIEDYFEAKARLMTPQLAKACVCWVDDERGAEVARRATALGLPVATVGTAAGVDFRLGAYSPVPPLGGMATLEHEGRLLEVRLALPGRYNMIDAAVALAMLVVAGHPAGEVLSGMADAQVPGRMQSLPMPVGAPAVVVDFAHTPQAVEAALDALRASFPRVVTVLGCGGDRDPQKRPEMGRAAATGSDVVVVTDDNPRTEDPAAIRAAVLAGAVGNGGEALVVEVAGRRAAIEHALQVADGVSVVAILGKGHEQGQEVAGEIIPFDDAVEALAAWGRIKGGRP